jgi:hypothetical protein
MRFYFAIFNQNAACTLPVHCLYTAGTLPVHCLYTAGTLPVHCRYTAFLNVRFWVRWKNCKKKKATISFVSVRPYQTTRFPRNGFSLNLLFRYIFANLSRKFNFHQNLTRIAVILHEDPRTHMIISRWILLRMRNVSDKIVESIKTHFMFTSLPPLTFLEVFRTWICSISHQLVKVKV